jgi:hypothetical protein
MNLLNFSMCLFFYMGYMARSMVFMDCTLNNFMHFSVHPEQPPVHAGQFYLPHDPLEISMCLTLYMWYLGVMVYMNCTLINLMQFLLHHEQPPVHADLFDVPHDLLELFCVPVFQHVLHKGHGVHGLHPDQPNALLSASRRTSCSC